MDIIRKKVLFWLSMYWYFIRETFRSFNAPANFRKQVLRFLLQSFLFRVPSDEQKEEARLEEIRQEMEQTHTDVSFDDFGAVSPDAGLSQEEMYRGRKIVSRISDICKRSAKKPFHCRMMRNFVKIFQPKKCLELGTNLGISGGYLASALNSNGHGVLLTLEGAVEIATVAGRNFQKLGLKNVEIIVGRFQDTLDGVLKNQSGIDFAFIDGHHDYQATVEYFSRIRAVMPSGGFLIFDDIAWSEGMKQAWTEIKNHGTVAWFVDLGSMGICFLR